STSRNPFAGAVVTGISLSPQELEAELHLPRVVGLAGDLSEIRAAVDVRVRAAEANAVECVERLGAELCADLFGNRELLEDREIRIVDVVVAQIRDQRRQISEGERRRLAKDGSIEPAVQTVVGIAADDRAAAVAVGAERLGEQARGVAGRDA